MAEDGRNACAEAEPLVRERAGGRVKPVGHPFRHEEHGQPALGSVGQQHENSCGLAQDAEHISRPDIAAAHGADIHAPRLGNQKPRGDRAQQIGDQHDQDVTNNWHILILWRARPKFKAQSATV